MHCSKFGAYSITSSARASTMGGISRLSALAVFRLITRAYLDACSTGKSAGLTENFVYVNGGATMQVDSIRAVAHQTPCLYIIFPSEHAWKPVP